MRFLLLFCLAYLPDCVRSTGDMPPKELTFITGNNNKLAEVQAILRDVVPLRSRSLEQVEIQGTTEDISKDKCRRAADLVCNPFPWRG